jgi:hypothetical protein
MLKDNAAAFVALGERMNDAQALWALDDYLEKADDGIMGDRLNEKGKKQVRYYLKKLSTLSERLNLIVSQKLISRRMDIARTPETCEEFETIIEVVKDELQSRLFLFVPNERAPYWEKDDLLSDKAKAKFPKATAELRSAGNAYAAALAEGSIYYSMRALEHGLRALANDVGKTFDVQNWQNIINEIESQLEAWRKNGIPEMDKATKDARLQFLSEAAKEFAYFKDGWRNYVAHAKVPYTEHQALTVLSHVVDFIERLSVRLAE